MFEILSPFAYIAFHLIVFGSLFLGKLIYPKMHFPTKNGLIKILPVSLAFIIWDFLVTNHWWYFSDKFTLIKIGPIPIEEILFFLTVPIALLVITENLNILLPKLKEKKIKPFPNFFFYIFQLILFILLFVSVISNWQYSATVCLLGLFSFQKKYFENKIFLCGFITTLITTFVFNLYLTYLPIVSYNELYKSSLKILTIPIEDFLYGLILYSYIFKQYYGQSFFSKTT